MLTCFKHSNLYIPQTESFFFVKENKFHTLRPSVQIYQSQPFNLNRMCLALTEHILTLKSIEIIRI